MHIRACRSDFSYRCNRQGIECTPLVRDSAPKKRRRVEASEAGQENGSLPIFSSQELSVGVSYYRSNLLEYFPFVVPPELCGLSSFVGAQPFLSLVFAMLGCTQHRARQRTLAIGCRSYLGDHVLQQGEKSLDLVQGILILTYWYHFQFALGASQRNTYLHMAIAMVGDLELNRPPFSRSRLKMWPDSGFDIHPEGPADHTLEEKRAFLGCVYLTSIMSKCSVNIDAPRFSDYADTCAQELETSTHCSDHSIVAMLQLQQIIERFEAARSACTQSNRATGLNFDFNYNSFHSTSNVDAMAFVEDWEHVLAQHWESIRDGAKIGLMHLQYHYARVRLYEVCLGKTLFPTSHDRLAVLNKCVAAMKSLHTTLMPLSEEPLRLLDVPAHFFAECNHMLFVTIQLCSVRCEGWSATFVEQELGLTTRWGSTIRNIETLLDTLPQDSIPDFIIRITPVTKRVNEWYVSKVTALTQSDSDQAMQVTPSETELDADFLGQFLNLDDNLWLQNIFEVDPNHGSI